MAYLAPYIDSAGLHLPSYDDILNDLMDKYKSIYGQDVYLGTDSADYQMLAAFALKIFDSNNGLQLVYNNRGPQTATGAGLDSLLKLNGIKRNQASYSTCNVTINGTAGTVITSGVVQDTAGYKWDLPATVTIPLGGSIDVTATCETIGAINATSGTLTKISTPTAGWISVTNAAAASPGQPVETDSKLKQRQAISVDMPSKTMVSGTRGAIAALLGVTRSEVYENPTDGTVGSLPPHSITAVVEGGTDADIANAIYNNHNGGCNFGGDVTVIVTDPNDNTTLDVKFFHVAYTDIYAAITVHGLAGYVSSMLTDVQTAIVNYLNSLSIGQTVSIGALWSVAMSCNPDITKPNFSVTAVLAGTSLIGEGTTDIVIDYNKVAKGTAANIVVTAV